MTTSDGDEKMDLAYIMSYWNGEPPKNQVEYIDDIVIKTDTPANRDAEANRMIGPAPESADTVLSLPPIALRVE